MMARSLPFIREDLMGIPMNIELATPQDAEAILQLQYAAYQSEAAIYNDPFIPPLTQTLDQLSAQFSTHTFLKATIDGRLVGSVRGQRVGETGYIGRLVVDPAHQGQSIGSQLMALIEAALAPVERYELFTGDRSTRNIGLYQRLGYQPVRSERLNDRVTMLYLEKVVLAR
jgi:ribosomal protein S18 acetylase RimI-like enzyme